MKKHGVLDVVTDSFNLKDHGRSDGNNRNYLVESVKAILNNPFTKERLKLGELYGYFGHNRREMAGKLELNETEIIYRDSKPVVIDNIPACRTIDISVDDQGIVTYKQEILDTPSGRAVKALVDAGVGGWSWVTGGVQTIKGVIAKSFHGFDYVKHPSYISTSKQQMMFESTGCQTENELIEMMLESQGFDKDQGIKICAMLEKKTPSIIEYEELTQDVMMLESIINERDNVIKEYAVTHANRETFMLEALKNSPIIINQSVLTALTNMKDDNDCQTVKAFFESLIRDDLPLGSKHTDKVIPTERKAVDSEVLTHAVRYNQSNNPFNRK